MVEPAKQFVGLDAYEKLLKSGVLKEARATFSVVPGLDAHRPEQRTAWPGLSRATSRQGPSRPISPGPPLSL